MLALQTSNPLARLILIAGLAVGAATLALPPGWAVLAFLCLTCLVLMPFSPLIALMVTLTLAPLRSLIGTESGLSLPLDIGQLLLIAYLGVWLGRRLWRRESLLKLQADAPLLAALGLIAVLSLGAWTSQSLAGWLAEWLKWWAIALLIWTLSVSVDESWRWLVFAVVISAVANALVGLYIFFGGSGADHLVILGRFFRAFGTFGQPNPFGGFMGIALPLSLTVAWAQLSRIWSELRSRRRWPRSPALIFVGSALASVALAAALLASWSRGAWLGAAVALICMLIALPRRLSHGLALAAVIAALVAGAWSLGLLPRSIMLRLTTAATNLITVSDVRGVLITPTNYAVTERLAHWQAAVYMAEAAPYFGIGLGNYEVAYDEYRLIFWEAALGHAHNMYLNLLAETGAVGLVAYLAFWVTVFRLTWSLRRQPDPFSRCIAIGLLGSWVYVAVHSVFDNLYVNNLFLHIGVLLGILAILHRRMTQALELD
ncbi:MAG: O-antigen ligase family protein [Chloroflexi bacterium]|nr:O-antigen ligase family protein [Chloroflexota bacterium]